jgi:hypothetical protein
MKQYRFKTIEEFKRDRLWDSRYNGPHGWHEEHAMDKFYGQDIPSQYNVRIESKKPFDHDSWVFRPEDCILKEEEL